MSSPVGQFLETVMLSGIIEVEGMLIFTEICSNVVMTTFFVILTFIELIILVTFLATSNHKAFLADPKAR